MMYQFHVLVKRGLKIIGENSIALLGFCLERKDRVMAEPVVCPVISEIMSSIKGSMT